mmetsp:Transcript_23142/g.28401  ORF Transcript_23142/g.28401 Transcript_23142/m.28401 type:complete len:87 (+) Transcript_23142:70-330(+)
MRWSLRRWIKAVLFSKIDVKEYLGEESQAAQLYVLKNGGNKIDAKIASNVDNEVAPRMKMKQFHSYTFKSEFATEIEGEMLKREIV